MTAVVGQELLSAGRTVSAMKILDMCSYYWYREPKARGFSPAGSWESSLGTKRHRQSAGIHGRGSQDQRITRRQLCGSVRAHDNLGIAYSVMWADMKTPSAYHDLQLQMAHAQGDCKEMIIGYNRLGVRILLNLVYIHMASQSLANYAHKMAFSRELLSDLTLIQRATAGRTCAQTHDLEAGDLEVA